MPVVPVVHRRLTVRGSISGRVVFGFRPVLPNGPREAGEGSALTAVG